jgi:hypothetical protein
MKRNNSPQGAPSLDDVSRGDNPNDFPTIADFGKRRDRELNRSKPRKKSATLKTSF